MIQFEVLWYHWKHQFFMQILHTRKKEALLEGDSNNKKILLAGLGCCLKNQVNPENKEGWKKSLSESTEGLQGRGGGASQGIHILCKQTWAKLICTNQCRCFQASKENQIPHFLQSTRSACTSWSPSSFHSTTSAVIKLPKTRACTKTKMFFISPQVVNIYYCVQCMGYLQELKNLRKAMSLQTWIFWGNEGCLSRTQKGEEEEEEEEGWNSHDFAAGWLPCNRHQQIRLAMYYLNSKDSTSYLISPFEHFTCPFTLLLTHSYFSSPSNSFITAKRKISHAILYWVVCITSVVGRFLCLLFFFCQFWFKVE